VRSIRSRAGTDPNHDHRDLRTHQTAFHHSCVLPVSFRGGVAKVCLFRARLKDFPRFRETPWFPNSSVFSFEGPAKRFIRCIFVDYAASDTHPSEQHPSASKIAPKPLIIAGHIRKLTWLATFIAVLIINLVQAHAAKQKNCPQDAPKRQI